MLGLGTFNPSSRDRGGDSKTVQQVLIMLRKGNWKEGWQAEQAEVQGRQADMQGRQRTNERGLNLV